MPVDSVILKLGDYTLPDIGRNVHIWEEGIDEQKVIMIAAGHDSSPQFTLLKWDGSSISEVTDYEMGTSNTVYGVHTWQQGSDRMIAVSHVESPYFTLLKWDGTDISKSGDYELPGAAYGVHTWGEGSDRMIAVAHHTSPRFTLLKWDGTSISESGDYELPGTGRGVHTWEQGTDRIIAIAHVVAPRFTLLKWDGTSVSVLDDYELPSSGNGVHTWEEGTDRMIAVSHDNAPYFTLLKWDGTDISKSDDYELPSIGYGVHTWQQGTDRMIAVAHDNAPYFTLLKWDGTDISNSGDYELPGTSYGVYTWGHGMDRMIIVSHSESPFLTFLTYSIVSDIKGIQQVKINDRNLNIPLFEPTNPFLKNNSLRVQGSSGLLCNELVNHSAGPFQLLEASPLAINTPAGAKALRHASYTLEFGGADDYVVNPLSMGFMARTVETWFKTTTNDLTTIFSSTGASSAVKGLRISTNVGNYSLRAALYSGVVGSFNIVGTETDYLDGEWHHLAFVWDGTTDTGGIKLYVDGNEVDTDTAHRTYDEDSYDVHFGANAHTLSEKYDGAISEVRVWDTARTQQQIQDNMNKTLTGNETGLVGYWPMRKGWGFVLEDMSVNNNHGIIYGADWGKVWKEPNYALELNGTNAYVWLPLNQVSPITIEMWVQVAVAQATKSIIDYTDGADTNSWSHSIITNASGQVQGRVWDGSDKATAASAFATSIWTHWAITSVNNGQLILYKDGVYQSAVSIGTMWANGNRFNVGRRRRVWFAGLVRDIRIWDVVRSEANIADNMDKVLNGDETGLVGYWPVDEGEGTTLYDKTANNNHGTIYGATWEKVW